MHSEGLKAGPTKSNIRSGVTSKNRGLGGGATKLGPPQNQKDTSASAQDNIIVKFNDHVVTPKELITKKFEELAKLRAEEIESKQKVLQKPGETKMSSSIVESNQKSHYYSADKSSNSDVKISSSNIQEQSSFLDSKKSDGTYSDSDSRRDQSEQQEKKPKVKKGLKEEDLEENIPINLSETPTMTILFLPSSFVNQEYGKKVGLLQRSARYDEFIVEKLGSDNFTNRHVQTFNYLPKSKYQQCLRVDKNDSGAFAAVWDLFDAQNTDQLNEFEQLQEDIKYSIDKEYSSLHKNPFMLLPTEVEAIQIHTKRPVLGGVQPDKPSSKTRTGANQTSKQVQSNTLSGGYTGQHGEDQKDSSSSHTGTKLNMHSQQQNFQSVTRTGQQGKTNAILEQQYKLMEQQQEVLDQEEEVYMRQMMEQSNANTSEADQILYSSGVIRKSLSYVERILNQNLYHKQYIQYRNYPEVKFEKMSLDDDSHKKGPSFKRPQVQKIEEDEIIDNKEKAPLTQLFSYKCKLSEESRVTGADWNPINKDLLAVSYASRVDNNGHIMFWSLKNPTFPERIITYPSRINCCKFSESQPNLVAAGTYDGIVAVWDIRRKSDKPVTENKEMAGKHTDAVWEVQWIGKGAKGTDKGESLVSISSDGRIVEWSMKKGLEYTNLMNLKRQVQQSQKDNVQEGVNFRWAAGFSFDFLKGESSMYLAATEEGTIHRCSKSYAEQYLDNYYGHSGPVYKIRCNPYFSDIFLTCSADWTCKLWNWREEQSKANFQSQNLYDEVLDFEWSPHRSTLFASVCKDGRLELWDLQKNNMLDPFACVMAPPGETWAAKTMVRFANNSPILVTGDMKGDIDVFRLYGYEDNDPSFEQERLSKLLYPAGYQKGQKDRQEQ